MKPTKINVIAYYFNATTESSPARLVQLTKLLEDNKVDDPWVIRHDLHQNSPIVRSKVEDRLILGREGFHFHEFELDPTHLFDNQFNTKCGLRLHDQCRIVYPNKDMRSGYIIINLDDLNAARSQVKKCGYCGSQFDSSLQTDWCPKPHLDIDLDQLHLTYLRSLYKPVLATPEQVEGRLMEVWPVHISNPDSPIYSQKIAKRLRDLSDRKIAASKKFDDEMAIISKLANLGVPYHLIKNSIYYDHKQAVCFGWRESLSERDKELLRSLLKDVDFKVEYE